MLTAIVVLLAIIVVDLLWPLILGLLGLLLISPFLPLVFFQWLAERKKPKKPWVPPWEKPVGSAHLPAEPPG